MFIRRKSCEMLTNTLLFERVLHGDCGHFFRFRKFCFSYSTWTGDLGTVYSAEHEHSKKTTEHTDYPWRCLIFTNNSIELCVFSLFWQCNCSYTNGIEWRVFHHNIENSHPKKTLQKITPFTKLLTNFSKSEKKFFLPIEKMLLIDLLNQNCAYTLLLSDCQWRRGAIACWFSPRFPKWTAATTQTQRPFVRLFIVCVLIAVSVDELLWFWFALQNSLEIRYQLDTFLFIFVFVAFFNDTEMTFLLNVEFSCCIAYAACWLYYCNIWSNYFNCHQKLKANTKNIRKYPEASESRKHKTQYTEPSTAVTVKIQ